MAIAMMPDENERMSKFCRTMWRNGRHRLRRDERIRAAHGDVQRAEIARWRREVRPASLADLASSAASVRWSPGLIELLCEELHITDAVEAILGTRIRKLQAPQYPRAVALAVILRHSWRPDDLDDIVSRLGLTGRHHD